MRCSPQGHTGALPGLLLRQVSSGREQGDEEEDRIRGMSAGGGEGGVGGLEGGVAPGGRGIPSSQGTQFPRPPMPQCVRREMLTGLVLATVLITTNSPLEPLPCPPVPLAMVKEADGSYTRSARMTTVLGLCYGASRRQREEWTRLPEEGGIFLRVIPGSCEQAPEFGTGGSWTPCP